MGVNLTTSHFILKAQILMHKMHQLPRFGGTGSADASAAAVFVFFSFWLSVHCVVAGFAIQKSEAMDATLPVLISAKIPFICRI